MIVDLLKRITTSLDTNSIPYMLSGSIAMNSYTVPRMTLDIDIVIELKEENLDAFLSLFDDTFYINHDTVRHEVTRQGMFNVIDHRTGFKVDFIVRKNSRYRLHEFGRRQRIRVDTPDEIRHKQREILLSKTMAERFRIGMETIRFGFQLAESGVRQNHPGMTEQEVKLAVFKRFYEKSFTTEDFNAILESQKRHSTPGV